MARTGNALVLVTFALATACTYDVPTEPLTARRASASWSVDVASLAGDPLAVEALSTHLDAEANGAGAANAATGGRAGGHADFVASGIRSKYTFTSLSTIPPAAKGRFELHRWFPDGRMLVMTGEVECMTLVPIPGGGLARMTGRVEQLRVDNVDVFVPPELDRTIWTVVDNGEGADAPPDIASGLLNFRSAAEAEFHCATGSIAFGFFITRGNLQVKPD